MGAETQPTSETLRQDAEAAAWLQERSPSLEVNPQFLTASRQRLESRIQRTAPRSRWECQWARPQFRLAANAFALVLLFISVIFFNVKLLGAARGSMPGDILYPVKLGEEQFRWALTLREGKQAELAVAYARERSNELQAMLIEGDYTYVEVTSMRLLQQMQQANLHLTQAQDLSPVRQLILQDDLNQTLTMQRPVLQALVSSAPPESRPIVALVIWTSQ